MAEELKTINESLRNLYGIDTISGIPIWRVVWSDDQLEKRLGTYDDYTPSGIYIRTVTEVREVPKYPWIKAKWILERLVVIPEISRAELPTTKISYEIMYPFEMFPSLLACQFVVDTVYAALGKSNLAKYKDPDNDGHEEDRRLERVKTIQNELFGNETDAGDALAHGQAIIVPRNFERN